MGRSSNHRQAGPSRLVPGMVRSVVSSSFGIDGRITAWLQFHPGCRRSSGDVELSALLTLSEVSKTYARREQPAVADVSVNVSEGELIALIGNNGAGKTTFFNLAIGLLRPDRGSCDLGLPIEDVGWCPQRDIIDWSLTVRQNIELAVELRGGVSRRALKCEIRELARMMELAPESGPSGGESIRRTASSRADH